MFITAAHRGTLAPLPHNHRVGLIILTIFSFLSLISTTALWLFISYKLLLERLEDRRRKKRRARARRDRRQRNASAAANSSGTTAGAVAGAGPHFPDFSLGLDAPCSGATGFERILELDRLAAEAQAERSRRAAQENTTNPFRMMHITITTATTSTNTSRSQSPGGDDDVHDEEEREPEIRNPFPILVYNLLLADMMEAMAYGLSFYWVAVDGIVAPSPVCWAQGWLGSTSNLAASLFLAVIAVNTFLTVGLGYKPPSWAVYTAIAGLWIFDFGINGAGVRNAEVSPAVPGESFFMRANVWCWISNAYDPWRFWAHYFWVIVSISITVILYSAVFFTLWRQKRSCRHLPHKRCSSSAHSDMPVTTTTTTRLASDGGGGGVNMTQRRRRPGGEEEEQELQPSGYHPAFLAYPFVYIACSVPLVVGRVTSLQGIDLGIPYFAFAGSVLALNGLFNSMLWTTTILFSAPQEAHDTGLDRFAFMRTPIREFGNSVIIRGPMSRRVPLWEIMPGHRRTRWWWWRHGGQRGWGERETSTPAAAAAAAAEDAQSMLDMPVVRSVVEVPAHESQNLAEGPQIQMDFVRAIRCERADGDGGDEEGEEGMRRPSVSKG